MPKFYVGVEWTLKLHGYTVVEAEDLGDAADKARQQVETGPPLGPLPFPHGMPAVEVTWPTGWQGVEVMGGGGADTPFEVLAVGISRLPELAEDLVPWLAEGREQLPATGEVHVGSGGVELRPTTHWDVF